MVLVIVALAVAFVFTSKIDYGSDYHTGTEYKSYTIFGIRMATISSFDDTSEFITNVLGYRPAPLITYGSTFWFTGSSVMCGRGDLGPNLRQYK